MVRLRSIEPVIYELLDEEGHLIGKVLLPRDTTIFGSEAATVLLQREIPRTPVSRPKVVEASRAA